MSEPGTPQRPPIPVDLDKVRRKEIINILKKLESGRTLSRLEDEKLKAYRAATAAGAPAVDPDDGDDAGPQPSSYASMKQAAAALKLPNWKLKWAKNHGCPAFRANRVYRVELIEWLAEHGQDAGDGPPVDGIDAKKEAEVAERVRKLKLANDEREGLLIRRAWVIERFARAAGEINALRGRSETEHAKAFAALAGDVPACREQVRRLWDDIMTILQGAGKHFEESDPQRSN
jgi:hypothetical protein